MVFNEYNLETLLRLTAKSTIGLNLKCIEANSCESNFIYDTFS